MIDLPSTLEKRATGFGFGKRWEPKNARGNDAPSPDKYNIPSCFDTDKKGPVLLGNQRDQPLQPRSSTPGPGAYTRGTTICKDAPKFTFRGKFVSKVRPSSPPPGTYNPKYNLLEKNNYSEITFGTGPKAKEDRPRPNTPGPGTYEVPSAFVKINQSSTSRFYNQVKNKVLGKGL